MKDLAVLIPSYNDNEALKRTLDSIDERNNSFTVFIVDDGSQDPVVVDQDAYPFPVEVIRLDQNQGITGALNHGLKEILEKSFHFIARLDAADLNHPNRFSIQYEKMIDQPELGMLGSNVNFLDEETHEPLFTTQLPLTSKALKRRIILHNCFIHPSVMIRSSVLENSGLYDPRYPYIEDLVLFTRITECASTENLSQPFVDCYIREKGISGKNFRAQMLSGIHFKLRNPKPFEPFWWAALTKRTANMILPASFRRSLKKSLKLTQQTSKTSGKAPLSSPHESKPTHPAGPTRVQRKIREAGGWLGSRFQAKSGILLYHRVDDPTRDPFRLCVSPENFAQQMEVLAESGSALSLSEFMIRKNAGELEPGAVCVTFDDGYLDVFTNALPILEKYEIPATVFVTTGNLGGPFWWDHLADLVYYTEDLPQSLPDLPGFSFEESLSTISRDDLFRTLHDYLRSIPVGDREHRISSLESAGFSGSGDVPRAISPEELEKVSKHHLLTIGAHTANHSRLSSLSYGGQVNEIKESVEVLSEIVGKEINSLSYPFGLKYRDWTEETCKASAAAGIQYGFTADRKAVTHHTPPFEIPRIWIHDREGEKFRRQMKFWLGSSFSKPASPAS